MSRAASALLAFATVISAAPVPKGMKHKPAELTGTWEVAEWYSQGNKVETANAGRWVIDGEKLTIERPTAAAGMKGKMTPAMYELRRPKGGGANALDFVSNVGNAAGGRTFPGMMELDGDTLRFCYAAVVTAERPAECKPDKWNVMYVFTRVESK